MRALLLAHLALLATPAAAATDEAWAAFRADVATACRALVTGPGEAAVEVNAFGSEHYGAAIVTVAQSDGSAERMVCIYDKVAKTAEMTSPFMTGD